jgi:hypothetical protein
VPPGAACRAFRRALLLLLLLFSLPRQPSNARKRLEEGQSNRSLLEHRWTHLHQQQLRHFFVAPPYRAWKHSAPTRAPARCAVGPVGAWATSYGAGGVTQPPTR